jgi:GT2 family glycosyltransferase
MQTYPNYEVLVVDNGSSDHTGDYVKQLKRKYKNLKYLNTGKNLGYVGGNNRGIESVLKEGKSKYLVILNDDVRVERDWLENLITGFNDPEVGICTSKILLYYPYLQLNLIPKGKVTINRISANNLSYHALNYKEGFDRKGELLDLPFKCRKKQVYYLALPYGNVRSNDLEVEFKGEALKIFIGDQRIEFDRGGRKKINTKGEYVIQNAGSIFDKKRMFFKDRFLFEFDRQLSSQIVDAGCGAAMAIRTDLIKTLGSFKGRYFMYGEDTELSFRYKKAGFKTKYVNDAVCYHWFWGSSMGKVSRIQTFYGTRNRLWFIYEYFGFFRFLYYYLRTSIRTIIWGMKTPFSRDARMFFACYVSVLRQVWSLR